METLAHSSVGEGTELRLLLNWEQDHGRVRRASALSVAAHVVAVILLILIPRTVLSPPQREARRITPLIEPPTDLTQPTPNKGKISKEITADAEIERPRIHTPPSPPSSRRPAARIPGPPHPPAPAPLPEPPHLDASAQAPRSLPPGPQVQTPPPQIQEQEQPKLALETPTAPPPSPSHPKIPIPDASVSGALRTLARGDGSEGGLVLGDNTDIGPGGIGEARNLPPSPGRAASSLQLLSDPKGVDFRPYLIRVLANVRRNWFAVMPESAREGRRGKVQIQFAISRDGNVPKLVIVMPSGTEAFDRAAVAGISASNPFPPLPGEFPGDVIRLQFTFGYNLPRN
jgi:TonB family protein